MPFKLLTLLHSAEDNIDATKVDLSNFFHSAVDVIWDDAVRSEIMFSGRHSAVASVV